MTGFRGVVLTVRFLMELTLLTVASVWGFSVGAGAWAWLLGIGAPLVVAVIWGMFVAPKARWPLPVSARVVLELVLFGAGALALATVANTALAVAFAALAVVTSLLNAYDPRSIREEGIGG